jgi:RNA polymerase sporulation-specific sigma factor
VERFDPSFAVKFSTYAVPTIIGEIKGFLRDDGAVKIQRSVKENYGKIRRGQETLRQRLGREATVSEIAALLELDPEDIIFALDACQAPFCLNAAFTGNDLETPTLLDRLSATDDVCPLEERLALNAALTRLPPREEDILRRRFFQEETQTVIAEALGISQVQISRLEKSALLKLRRYLAAE